MKGIRIIHTKKGKAKSGMKVFNYKLFIQRALTSRTEADSVGGGEVSGTPSE